MKKVLFLFLILVISGNLSAQVMGVSNSKLTVINGETASRNQMEFEPGFGYFWAHKQYDEDGKLIDLSPETDSTAVFQAMAFRFTYGISDRVESGILIAADMSSLSFGIKYNFFNKGRFSSAIMAGGTFANESDIVAVNTGIFGKTLSMAIGLTGTQNFNDRLSLDVDVQYQNIRNDKTSYSNDIFANAEVGFMIKDKKQIIGGFSYTVNNHTNKYDGLTNQLITFNVGGTLSGKNYDLILFTPIALYGKNYNRLNGINFALTIHIN